MLQHNYNKEAKQNKTRETPRSLKMLVDLQFHIVDILLETFFLGCGVDFAGQIDVHVFAHVAFISQSTILEKITLFKSNLGKITKNTQKQTRPSHFFFFS